MIWTARTGRAWSQARKSTSETGTTGLRQAPPDPPSRHLHNVTLSYFRRLSDTPPSSASRLSCTQLNCGLGYVACDLWLGQPGARTTLQGEGVGVKMQGPGGGGAPSLARGGPPPKSIRPDKRHKSQDPNPKLVITNKKLVSTNHPTLQLAKFFNEFQFSKNLIFRIFPGDPHDQRTSPLPRGMREGRPTPG